MCFVGLGGRVWGAGMWDGWACVSVWGCIGGGVGGCMGGIGVGWGSVGVGGDRWVGGGLKSLFLSNLNKKHNFEILCREL